MRKSKNDKNPSKYHLESVEETLLGFFRERPEVVLAYLFGSFVKNTRSYFHDIDVGVFVVPDRLGALDRSFRYGYAADLSSRLANLLKYNAVDLVLLNHAPPLLIRQVIGTGKLVFCRSEEDRIAFEVASLKRHADTAYIRRIKGFYMNQRIQKGLPAYG
jgi:predicted nucleotidyltransferase